MADRRRTPRYVLETPLRGDAMPMREVAVEELAGARAVILSSSNHAPNEELTIYINTPAGLRSHAARVLSSAPMSAGVTTRFRLELRVQDAGPIRAEESSEEAN